MEKKSGAFFCDRCVAVALRPEWMLQGALLRVPRLARAIGTCCRRHRSTDVAGADAASSGEQALTPPPADYLRLKKQAGDHVLLYQKGKFYELFGDDARNVAHRVPLRRSEVSGMVGFPVHRATHWVPALVHAGFTLAIADQLSPDTDEAFDLD
jgi:hypothetical protein